jgi:gas vesicle protein
MSASNKLPFIFIGSAVGGTLAYLFATDSGRNFRRSLSNFRVGELPEKIDSARQYVERQGRTASERMRGVIDRAKESVDAGTQAYRDAEQSHHSQLRQIENRNTQVTSTIHRSLDNLNKTVYTFEESVIGPLYEMSAIAMGVIHGVRDFFCHEHRKRELNTGMGRGSMGG